MKGNNRKKQNSLLALSDKGQVQGLSILLVESLSPFALSPSKGRPEWFSKLTTNGLEELPPTIERPRCSCVLNQPVSTISGIIWSGDLAFGGDIRKVLAFV